MHPTLPPKSPRVETKSKQQTARDLEASPANVHGLTHATILGRLHKGQHPDDVLLTPLRRYDPKRVTLGGRSLALSMSQILTYYNPQNLAHRTVLYRLTQSGGALESLNSPPGKHGDHTNRKPRYDVTLNGEPLQVTGEQIEKHYNPYNLRRAALLRRLKRNDWALECLMEPSQSRQREKPPHPDAPSVVRFTPPPCEKFHIYKRVQLGRNTYTCWWNGMGWSRDGYRAVLSAGQAEAVRSREPGACVIESRTARLKYA